MARVTVYKNSVVASILSVCGYVAAIAGIIAAFSGSVVAGIISVLAGIGLVFWAAAISQNKQFKIWKNKIEASGLAGRIKADVNTAVMVYNSNPDKKTLAYISQLNPTAGSLIAESIHSQAQN